MTQIDGLDGTGERVLRQSADPVVRQVQRSQFPAGRNASADDSHIIEANIDLLQIGEVAANGVVDVVERVVRQVQHVDVGRLHQIAVIDGVELVAAEVEEAQWSQSREEVGIDGADLVVGEIEWLQWR